MTNFRMTKEIRNPNAAQGSGAANSDWVVRHSLVIRYSTFLIGLLLAVFCGGVELRAPAANLRYTLEHWDADRGLPEDTVFTMTQTRDGYLWLGTLDGLVRFDG